MVMKKINLRCGTRPASAAVAAEVLDIVALP